MLKTFSLPYTRPHISGTALLCLVHLAMFSLDRSRKKASCHPHAVYSSQHPSSTWLEQVTEASDPQVLQAALRGKVLTYGEGKFTLAYNSQKHFLCGRRP